MAQVKLYSWEGKEVGSTELPDALFALPIKSSVVHEVIVAQEANAREIFAHVKDRSQVAGTGKKPWKQKGTGRARHGSRRSPIWVGGGITHGPNPERVFAKKVNRKAKRTALAMLLSDKLGTGDVVVVENFAFPERKTKFAAQMRKALPGGTLSALVILAKNESDARYTMQNLPKTQSIGASNLNVRDLAKHRVVIASTQAIAEMEQTFTG